MPNNQNSPSKNKKICFSRFLILAGILLLAFALFPYVQNQLTLMNHQPPPAPALSSGADDNFIALKSDGNSLTDNPLPVLEMPTATPSPTTTATAIDTPIPPTSNPSLPSPTPAPTHTPTPTATPNPFPPAQSPPNRIVAPSIGLDSPIESIGWHEESINGQKVSVWDVAEYAAGWHKNSALPGNGGNVVLSGHHNIKGEVFRYIVDLNSGDSITLYADGRAYEYTVTQNFIVKDKGEPPEVRRQNAQWIGPFNDERLTLISCWPYTNNTHRVIIIAKPKYLNTPAK